MTVPTASASARLGSLARLLAAAEQRWPDGQRHRHPGRPGARPPRRRRRRRLRWPPSRGRSTLAEPEGYRPHLPRRGPAHGGAAQAAAGGAAAPSGTCRSTHCRGVTSTARRTPAEQALIEPLSERELDVLRLLDSDLAGPAIARELVVSLATVRTHTRNIYAKLGVNNRRGSRRAVQPSSACSRAPGPPADDLVLRLAVRASGRRAPSHDRCPRRRFITPLITSW